MKTLPHYLFMFFSLIILGCSTSPVDIPLDATRSPTSFFDRKANVQTLKGKLAIYEDDELIDTIDTQLIFKMKNFQENVYIKNRSINDDHNYLTVDIQVLGLPEKYERYSKHVALINIKHGLDWAIAQHKKDPTNIYDKYFNLESESSVHAYFQFLTPDSVEEFIEAPQLTNFGLSKSTFFGGYFGGKRYKFSLRLKVEE